MVKDVRFFWRVRRLFGYSQRRSFCGRHSRFRPVSLGLGQPVAFEHFFSPHLFYAVVTRNRAMTDLNSSSGNTSSDVERDIDAICDRFEHAWQAKAPLRIEDLLESAPKEEQGRLLRELLELEIFYQTQSGYPPRLADCLQRFANHQSEVQDAFAAVRPQLEPPTQQPKPAASSKPGSLPENGGAAVDQLAIPSVPSDIDPSDRERAINEQLLLAVLAFQNGFVALPQLITALEEWARDKSQPLGQWLLNPQQFSANDFALLQDLATAHVRMHGNDPRKSLAALSSLGPVREEIDKAIQDADVHASLMLVGAAGLATDPYSTVGQIPAAWPAKQHTVSAPAHQGDFQHDEMLSSDQRFRILRLHKSGGLGKVFLAVHQEFNRRVALKEIKGRYASDPQFRARFLTEARITGNLEHPGIVPVYSLGQHQDGRPFYVMRFIRGDSLTEAIEAFHQGKTEDDSTYSLQLRKLLGRFIDVCEAIEYAHSRGVLHRDLKPGNIMLGRYGETLVVDWGLAKTLGQKQPGASEESAIHVTDDADSQPTQSGTTVGTLPYMSPEQAEGRHDELGPASDVYGLGATLYALLTGQAPFSGNDSERLKQQVIRGEFAPPRSLKPEIPRQLEAICLKAMSLQPRDRYASSQELAADVERWLADEPVMACPETRWERISRWARRHRPLVRAAAISATVALVVLGLSLWMVNAARNATTIALEKEKAALAQVRETQELEKTQRLRAESLASERQEQLSRIHVASGVRAAELGDPLGALPWYAAAARLHPSEFAKATNDDGSPHQRRLKQAIAQSPQLAWHRYQTGLIAFDKSTNGSHIVTLTSNGQLTMTELATGKERSISLEMPQPIFETRLSPGGQRLLLCDATGSVRLFDGRTLEPLGPWFRFADQFPTPEAVPSDDPSPLVPPSPPPTVSPPPPPSAPPPSTGKQSLHTGRLVSAQPRTTNQQAPRSQTSPRPSADAVVGEPLPNDNDFWSEIDYQHDFHLHEDGRHVLIEHHGMVAIWDGVAGVRVGPIVNLRQLLGGHDGELLQYDFLPQGRLVVTDSARIVVVGAAHGCIEREIIRANQDIYSFPEFGPPSAPHSSAATLINPAATAAQRPPLNSQDNPVIAQRVSWRATTHRTRQPEEAMGDWPDLITRPSQGGGSDFVVMPDSVRVVAAGWLYDLRTGFSRPAWPIESEGSWSVDRTSLSPDGRMAVIRNYTNGELRVVDFETNTYWPLKGNSTSTHSVAFSQDGRHLALVHGSGDGMDICEIFDAATGEPVCAPLQWAQMPADQSLLEFELLSDNRIAVWRLTIVEEDGKFGEVADLLVDVWDLPPRPAKFLEPGPLVLPEATGDTESWFRPNRNVNEFGLLRSGQFHTFFVEAEQREPGWFRYLEVDGVFRVQLEPGFTAEGELQQPPPLDHARPVLQVSIRPGSRYAQTVDIDQNWRLWDRKTGKLLIEDLASPEGQSVRVRRVAHAQPSLAAPSGAAAFPATRLSPQVGLPFPDDSTRARRVMQWRENEFRCHVRFSPDESRVLVAHDGEARIYLLPSGRIASRIVYQGEFFCAEFSPNGRQVALAVHPVSDDDRDGLMRPPPPAIDPSARRSASGRLVAYEPADIVDGQQEPPGATLRLWDAEAGQPLSDWLLLAGRNPSLRFDASGKQLLAVYWVRSMQDSRLEGVVMSAASGQRQTSLSGKLGFIFLDAAFSRDGNHILTICGVGGLLESPGTSIQLWNSATGEQTRQWFSHALRHDRLAALSDDGQKIALAINQNTIQVRAIADDHPITPPMRLAGDLIDVWFSSDGRYVQTLSESQGNVDIQRIVSTIVPYHQGEAPPVAAAPSLDTSRQKVPPEPAPELRLWDAATGQPVSLPPFHMRAAIDEIQLPPIDSLAAVSQSLAEQRIDEVGALVPLSQAELLSVRGQASSVQYRLAAPLAAQLRRAAEQAWAATDEGNEAAATASWHRLCLLQPDELAWRERLAHSMVEAARYGRFAADQWDDVERGLNPLQRSNVRSAKNLYAEALVRLRVGDAQGYRNACERLAARYADVNADSQSTWVVRAALAGPQALIDFAALEPLLQDAEDRALYYLRLGQFSAARETLSPGGVTPADMSLRGRLLHIWTQYGPLRDAAPALGIAVAPIPANAGEALHQIRLMIDALEQTPADMPAPPPAAPPASFRRLPAKAVDSSVRNQGEVSYPWTERLELDLLLGEVLDLTPGPLLPLRSMADDPLPPVPNPPPASPDPST